MTRSRYDRWLIVMLFASCQVLIVSQATADDRPELDENIVYQLDNPAKLEVDQMPLNACLDFLADYHDIPIVLDIEELSKLGVSVETPVTETSKPGSHLDALLLRMLNPLKLSFMIKDHELRITSKAKAEKWQEKYAQELRRRQGK
jgi:hypothetical protein